MPSACAHQGIPRNCSGALAARGPVDGDGEDEIGRSQAFAQFLAQALEENLSHELLVVLDDVDELDPSRATGQLIASLCRQAPPSVHLVLSSRAGPPFPIERLRGQGQVLEVGGAARRSPQTKWKKLVRGVTGDGDATTATSLHQLTDGWPAAVRLAVEALRSAARNDGGRCWSASANLGERSTSPRRGSTGHGAGGGSPPDRGRRQDRLCRPCALRRS